MLIPLLGAVLAAVTCLQAPAWADTPPPATAVAEVPQATRLVALNKSGELEAFARVAGGTVWHTGQREPGADWSDWSTLGGAADTDPVVATNADGRLEVFTTHGGIVSTMASTTTGDSTWSTTWVTHGGSLANATGVTVAANQDGRLQVFGAGKDGTLKSMVQTAPGSVYGENWDPWTSMDAPTGVKLAGRPAVAMNSSGQLQVFDWGNDGHCWTRVQNKANTKNWRPWKALPTLSGGVQSYPAVARNQDGRLQVFVRDTKGNVYYVAQNKAGQQQWGSSWTQLTGQGTPLGGVATVTDLNVAANADGRLEVFARQSDNSLLHTMQTQPSSVDSWSTPSSLGGAMTNSWSVAANRDGRLEAVAVQATGGLAHSAQEESNPPPSDKWADWEILGYGPAPCAGTGTTACLSVVNVATGHALAPEDTTDPTSGVGATPVKNGVTTPRQRWSMIRDKSGFFQLKNRATNRCLDFVPDQYLPSSVDWDRTLQVKCNTRTQQRWYIQPSITPGAYLIRNVDNGRCLTEFPSLDSTGNDRGELPSETDQCNTSAAADQWRLSISGTGTAPGLSELATRYALALCAQDNNCGFTWTGDENAYVDQHSCVNGTLTYNATKAEQEVEISVADSAGWENTVGGSLTVGYEAGVSVEVFEAKVSTAIEAHYDHAWNGSTTTTVDGHIKIPPGEYGWLGKGRVVKEVTGTWTFNQNESNFTWTEPGQSTVPAVDGTDGVNSTAVVLNSSNVPPNNC
ncbi:RICIN domain-containing protein [Streptomyces sp. BK340]|uniref:RICIN domain-containing protein n=1 Tax=Streptomyces sp. BK340 TaxID=2572903 RepID=UPI00119FD254|nr:RICIN domain-containing protein [Streptomyces sp. BK340]